MSEAPKLTERDKNKLTEQIKDTVVKNICTNIVDETTDDAYFVSGQLKQALGNKINEVLSSPENLSQISGTIFQSINASLRHGITGPLLLFSLLDNKTSYNEVKDLVTMIFNSVSSTDQKIDQFIKKLLTQLMNPPYNIWFKQTNKKMLTGGKTKNKTMRKRKYTKNGKRSKTYRKKHKGGAGLIRNLGITALADRARRSILFIGDGSFQLTAQEISTMIRHKLTPIIFLLNNDGYTIERVIHGRTQVYNDVQPWKYAELPKIFGDNVFTAAIETERELEQVLLDAKQHAHQLCFIELKLDREDCPDTLRKLGEACDAKNKGG